MQTVFDIFEKYEWWGVAGIMLCAALFVLLKYFSKKISEDMASGLENVGRTLVEQMSNQNDQLTKTLIEQQDKLVNHLISKDTEAAETHADMVEQRIELADDIVQKLKEIMYYHNSQRAFILEFHNSFENLSGVPFAKYSCTYEWFERGLVALGTKCVGLPFSQLSRVVSEMTNEGKSSVIYDNMEEMQEINPALYTLVKENKAQAIVYTGMYDDKNRLIGLLVLEYTIPLAEGHLELDELKIQATELTSIVNIHYKITKR